MYRLLTPVLVAAIFATAALYVVHNALVMVGRLP
jgi:hypothetical protein